MTHNILMKEVWGVHHLHNAHYLRILVRRLRRKIEQNPKQPRILVSELGVGYRLASGGESGLTAPAGARVLPKCYASLLLSYRFRC